MEGFRFIRHHHTNTNVLTAALSGMTEMRCAWFGTPQFRFIRCPHQRIRWELLENHCVRLFDDFVAKVFGSFAMTAASAFMAYGPGIF
jgi:hypothetical protein